MGRGNLGTRSSQGQGAYFGGNDPKTVSATFLFGELAARLEESDDPDPMSKVPTLDMAPVMVAKAEG